MNLNVMGVVAESAMMGFVPLDGYSYAKEITVPANSIDADCPWFPLDVYLRGQPATINGVVHPANLDFSKCKADGSDIRFTDKNLNPLKFERVENVYGMALSGGYTAPYTPDGAFYGSKDSGVWASSQTGTGVSGAAWLGYDFLKPVTLKSLQFYNTSDINQNVTSWKVQKSDNGSTWVDVQTFSVPNTASILNTLSITGTYSAQYWRILANANIAVGYRVWIEELWMFNENAIKANLYPISAKYNVLLPTVSDLSDTEFYMWYGNPNAYNDSIEAWQDKTGKSWTFNGNVKLQYSSTYGRRIASFDGSGDYFSLPNNVEDFKFLHAVGSTGKWTAEFMFKANSFAADQGLFDTGRGSRSNSGISVYMTTARAIVIQIYLSSSELYVLNLTTATGVYPNDLSSAHSIEIDYDQSLASNNCKVFIDGVLVGQGTKMSATPSVLSCQFPLIGALTTTTYGLNGYMLGMRLTNGRCRGGVVVDKFDIDGSDVVFCTNFDTIYDQNYTMVNHMGDTLVDATGNGNNGTATGTSVVNTNFGKARNFNGSSDFIQLGNVGNADFMTLTALYKRTLDNTADQFILGKGFTSSANPYYQYALEDTWAPTRYYETYFSIGGVASALTSTPTQAIVNQFHTMTGKFDGAQVSLDVDETWWRVSKTGVVSQYATNATIGRNPLSASAYFGGIINEIRMATIARSDAWIKAESLALADVLLTYADAA